MSKTRGLLRDMASLARRLSVGLVVLGVLGVGGVERSWAEPAVSDVESSHPKQAPTWVLYGEPGIPVKPGETTVTLPGGVPLVMVRISSGSFQMGRTPGEQDSYDREDPRHTVNIGYDFYMAKYELTKRQWQAVMGTTPWSGQSTVLNDPGSPAVNVSWIAIAGSGGFLEKLNQHLESTGQAVGGKPYRLPSEAEWEYACRAGTTTRYYWGDDPSYAQIGDYAWYAGNAYDVGERYAHVVGRKLPNSWGLYDMSGNVWEWCEDRYHSGYTGAPTDGSAWVAGGGSYRVERGGGWSSRARRCRSAFRYNINPSITYSSLGFRPSRSD